MTNLRVQNFTAAVKLLGERHERVKIGNNTTIEADWYQDANDEPGVNEQIVTVRLHGHAIVRLFANGDVEVRDCGYVTTTTYDRINAFLPGGYVANRRQGQGIVTSRRGDGATYEVEGNAWVRIPD